ncbi:MAG: hypothetical protein M1821_004843 [Bathelium mastoideum]|nr:MAG: hypothetical protein M1821_004843 [Bathelium mastoideum]KAI9689109.1 MAG: hypothetical protein M1822_000847 [Bathelium mastoideum]
MVNDIALTPRETGIIVAMLKSAKSWPDFDYVKLADLLSMSNPRSAANAVAAIKKKHFSEFEMPATPKKGGPKAARVRKSPSFSTSKKRKAALTSDDEAGPATPMKKKAASKARTKKAATMKNESDEDSSSTVSSTISKYDSEDEGSQL